MDLATLTGHIKDLNEANTAGKTDDVIQILEKLKGGMMPSEDLLRTSKAGVAIGRLRTHASPDVASLAKDVVRLWKESIDEGKKKRKREDGEVKIEEPKRVKAEAGSSSTASPATPTPKTDDKPKPKPELEDSKPELEAEATGSSSPQRRPPLSTIDSTRTVMRSAKTDGVTDKIHADTSGDGGGYDGVRDKCVVLIYDGLAGDSTAEKRILTERAVGIERAVYKSFEFSTGNDYRAKMRSLYLNLKDKGNPALRNEIVLGYISSEKVANMSKEEMASEEVRSLNEKIASDNLFKAKAVGEVQAETDAFKCGRCQQRKCTYYQMQTRSADEPMTTFVTCTNCNNRWKFS